MYEFLEFLFATSRRSCRPVRLMQERLAGAIEQVGNID